MLLLRAVADLEILLGRGTLYSSEVARIEAPKAPTGMEREDGCPHPHGKISDIFLIRNNAFWLNLECTI